MPIPRAQQRHAVSKCRTCRVTIIPPQYVQPRAYTPFLCRTTNTADFGCIDYFLPAPGCSLCLNLAGAMPAQRYTRVSNTNPLPPVLETSFSVQMRSPHGDAAPSRQRALQRSPAPVLLLFGRKSSTNWIRQACPAAGREPRRRPVLVAVVVVFVVVIIIRRGTPGGPVPRTTRCG